MAARRISRFRRWLRRMILTIVFAGLLAGGYAWWTYRGPTPPTEIFRGVTYSCERLPVEDQGGGLVYLIRVDLNAPGIELFATPLDPDAVAHGWEYKLHFVSSVVRDQHLAVAVNATLFTSESQHFDMPGDYARALETLVSDHVLNHHYDPEWMIGFDDQLNPSMPMDRPPTPLEFARAKWGVASQTPILISGKVNPWVTTQADHRSTMGFDARQKILWIACFEYASCQFAAQYLANKGATDAICLDSGHSTSMAIGPGASNVPTGSVISYYRPVANVFGIRAQPLNGN